MHCDKCGAVLTKRVCATNKGDLLCPSCMRELLHRIPKQPKRTFEDEIADAMASVMSSYPDTLELLGDA